MDKNLSRILYVSVLIRNNCQNQVQRQSVTFLFLVATQESLIIFSNVNAA